MHPAKPQGSDIEKDRSLPRKVLGCPLGYDSCSPCRPFVEGMVLPCGTVINGKPTSFPNRDPDTVAGDNLGKAIVIGGPTPSPKFIPNRCNWCGARNVEVHGVRDEKTGEIWLVCLVCDPREGDQ